MIHEVLTARGRFGPTAAGHPTIGQECPGCGQPIREGDVPALVNGTPASDEDATKAAQGRAYNAEAKVAHERCALPPRGPHRDGSDHH